MEARPSDVPSMPLDVQVEMGLASAAVAAGISPGRGQRKRGSAVLCDVLGCSVEVGEALEQLAEGKGAPHGLDALAALGDIIARIAVQDQRRNAGKRRCSDLGQLLASKAGSPYRISL